MSKIISILICVMVMLSLSACDFPTENREQSISEQVPSSPEIEATKPEPELTEEEEYRAAYKESIQTLCVLVYEKTVHDEKYANRPMVTSRIALPGFEFSLSADVLQDTLNAYELYSGYALGEEYKINLTVQDVVDLCTTPNAEKQEELDTLVKWYGAGVYPDGSNVCTWYAMFVAVVYDQYQEMNGKPFIDKDPAMYTAEDKYALAKWGLENIDYDYVYEVNSHRSDPKYDEYDIGYIDFLWKLDLADI